MIQKKKDLRNRLLEYLAEEAGCQEMSDLPTSFWFPVACFIAGSVKAAVSYTHLRDAHAETYEDYERGHLELLAVRFRWICGDNRERKPADGNYCSQCTFHSGSDPCLSLIHIFLLRKPPSKRYQRKWD